MPLTITIPAQEKYDEINNLFIQSEETTIRLEHSLVSISKWESKWQEPYLHKETFTREQELDYIKCMTISQNVKDEVYENLTLKNYNDIKDYISNKMSATWFSEDKSSKPNREIVTSELIYFWMTNYGIYKECEKWHFNRLMNLIRICSIKNSPSKKMSRSEILNRNRALNAQRKAAMHTRG